MRLDIYISVFLGQKLKVTRSVLNEQLIKLSRHTRK
jgi:hypothetical protein